ncbi:hypothetical protein Tco_0245731 [Tanacetum coccineum]
MDFPEFYKELEAEFWEESAKLMGLKLLQLELRLGKIPSWNSRPIKSAEILCPIWSKNYIGFEIGKRYLPIESIIASRSTDVIVESQ